LMKHWESVLDIKIMQVKYEDLITNQGGISRAMIKFCGLQWDDRRLPLYDTQRVGSTASYDQVRQPMYQRSIGRWKNYDAYLGPLKKALK